MLQMMLPLALPIVLHLQDETEHKNSGVSTKHHAEPGLFCVKVAYLPNRHSKID